jgi:hypothetical protein
MKKRHKDRVAAVPEQEGRRSVTIGWKEYVDFPSWSVRHVKVKIDTGARTSALGVLSYSLSDSGMGLVAELRMALHRRHPEKVTIAHAPVLGMVSVRNTSGMCEERPLVQTEVKLGLLIKRIPLTVTSRAGMLFAVILGRNALVDDFVVDVSRKYLLKTTNTQAGPAEQ